MILSAFPVYFIFIHPSKYSRGLGKVSLSISNVLQKFFIAVPEVKEDQILFYLYDFIQIYIIYLITKGYSFTTLLFSMFWFLCQTQKHFCLANSLQHCSVEGLGSRAKLFCQKPKSLQKLEMRVWRIHQLESKVDYHQWNCWQLQWNANIWGYHLCVHLKQNYLLILSCIQTAHFPFTFSVANFTYFQCPNGFEIVVKLATLLPFELFTYGTET